jgi:hypothetical protein
MTWSPDSSKLVVGSGDGVWLYELSGQEVTRRKLDGDGGRATSVAYDSSGGQIAAGFEDGLVRLWQAASGERVAQFSGHGAPVRSLAFNGEGTILASGAGEWHPDFVPRADGVEARLWDVTSGELRDAMQEDMVLPPVSHLAFSPDDTLLLVGQQGHGCTSPRCANGRLRFWQPGSGVIREVEVGHDIVFGGDGRLAAALSPVTESARVQILETNTGSQMLLTADGPEGFAYDLALSRGGSTVAVVIGEYGYGGRMAHVWDVQTGTELAVVMAGAPIALSEDGCFLAARSAAQAAGSQGSSEEGSTVLMWAIRQGTQPAGLAELTGTIEQLDFSPDGTGLAVVETDILGSRLHLFAFP